MPKNQCVACNGSKKTNCYNPLHLLQMSPGEENWSEARLQSECFKWFSREFPTLWQERRLYSVDNNAIGGAKAGIKKALGCVAGVADITYIFGSTIWFIELKLPGKRQGAEQKEFEKTVTNSGFHYRVVYTLQHFKDIIHEIHTTV